MENDRGWLQMEKVSVAAGGELQWFASKAEAFFKERLWLEVSCR